MATYAVNPDAVEHVRRLIEARQYVLDSDWGEVQPKAEAQNRYLESHSWSEYSRWHLGLTERSSTRGRRDELPTGRPAARRHEASHHGARSNHP